jgi:hypothetical protein
MENHIDKANPLPANDQSADASGRMPWAKPVLEEFGIAAATKNAGIINLDLDHALDIS